MQKRYYASDNTNVQRHFVYNGMKMGVGTKVLFNYDFYYRNAAGNYFNGYQYNKQKPSVFSLIEREGEKTIWYFNNCIVSDLVIDRDVKEIVQCVPYVEETDKDRIRKKKEKGLTWDYIWPGTVIYILSMLFITIFHERLWGWIAATILYRHYCYEQLTR
jgi:hypothetical protein